MTLLGGIDIVIKPPLLWGSCLPPPWILILNVLLILFSLDQYWQTTACWKNPAHVHPLHCPQAKNVVSCMVYMAKNFKKMMLYHVKIMWNSNFSAYKWSSSRTSSGWFVYLLTVGTFLRHTQTCAVSFLLQRPYSP